MRLPFLILHVSAGILAMTAGVLAMAFRKGSRNHRASGNAFVACMLTVASAGSYLGFIKSEMDNFTGGIFAFYLVATAWATARRGEGKSAAALDWITPWIAVAFGAINIAWGLEISRGETAVKNQSPVGAYFFFGILGMLCAAGDLNMLFGGGLTGRKRIARHVWRMCFGWFIATISLFIGQQRVFPVWLRGSYVLVVLAFLPLLFMVFWLVRVAFTGWYRALEPLTTPPDSGLP